MNKSRIYGANRLRKKLRRLDADIKTELIEEIRTQSNTVLEDAKARVPVNRGVLRDELRVVVEKSGFRAKIGLVGKKSNKKAFYGRFVEFGTPSTTYKRGLASGRKGRPRKPVQAQPFLLPALRTNEKKVVDAIKTKINDVMRRVSSSGVSDG